MRILAIGDMHHKPSNLIDAGEMQRRILTQVKDLCPDIVVLLGDLHDTFESIHSSVLTSIQDFVIKLSEMAQVYVIIGNHDLINNSVFLENKHPFNGFKRIPNVVVVDKVVNVQAPGGWMFFCPYTAPGRFQEALATSGLDYTKARIIFAHQEFKSSKMGAIIGEHGDVWPEHYPLVISGHIHEYQRLQRNIVYVGVPMDHSFGSDVQKTISLFTDESGVLEERRIDLHLPKRRTYDLTIEQAKAFEPKENTIARINLTDTTGNLMAFKKTAEYKKLESWAKIVPKPTDVVNCVVTKGRRDYYEILKAECQAEGQEVLSALSEAMRFEAKAT